MFLKFTNFFLIFTIISIPLSISISQASAVLSILFYSIHLVLNFRDKIISLDRIKIVFLLILGLYFSLFISFFVHFSEYSWNTNIIKQIREIEISDLWMICILPVAYSCYVDDRFRKSILYSFVISFILLTISGLVSVFTSFRLGPYIMSGFQVIDGQRLQHHSGYFMGKLTYLPIGFMNTHLTFGGINAIFVTGFLLNYFYEFRRRNIIFNIGLTLLLCINLFVFFHNQSRSAWMGVLFVFLYTIWHIRKMILQIPRHYFIILFVLSILLISFGFYVYNKNQLLQRAFVESVQENTAQNQRYFIYRNTLSLIADHLIIGIGAGNFRSKHWNESEKIIQKNEQLWYELSITPRGHAHNDFLHFLAIGGVVTGVIFLFFWIFLFYQFSQLINLFKSNFNLSGESLLFIGSLSMFVAGFFQCYLLDDEVVLPFYLSIGLFFASIKIHRLDFPKISFKSGRMDIFFVIGIVSISIGFILYRNQRRPDEVYKRKIKTEFVSDISLIQNSISNKSPIKKIDSSHGAKGFWIEGCLSHVFIKPIQPRKKPYSISIVLPENSNEYPESVQIDIFERDSFDQDQLYKVHKSKLLKQYQFQLQGGRNLFRFENIPIEKASAKFPDDVFFRDFYFRFHSKSKDFYLPQIDFGKLCDGN